MSDYPIYAEGYVAELLDDGKVIVWPDITVARQAELLEQVPVLQQRGHFFAVDIVLQPPKALFGEEDKDLWEPTRWHRLVQQDGSLWMETSDPEEIRREMSGEAYRYILDDLDDDEEAPEPPPTDLIHQQLFQTTAVLEWRDVDG